MDFAGWNNIERPRRTSTPYISEEQDVDLPLAEFTCERGTLEGLFSQFLFIP